MAHTWDPDRYLTYADERGRPFVELLARVDAEAPATVVDLGCGPGQPDRAARRALAGGARRRPRLQPRDDRSGPRAPTTGIAFDVADLRDWAAAAAEPVDVLVSNATLQWVPGHLDLLPGLVGRVAPGGWLAFQVPGNFDEPSHTIRARARRRGAVRRAHRAAWPRPPATTRRSTSTPCRPRLRRRRLGDDLPARARPARTRSSPGSPAPAPARRCRRCPTTCAADFEEEFKRRLRAAYPERDGRRGAAVPARLRRRARCRR